MRGFINRSFSIQFKYSGKKKQHSFSNVDQVKLMGNIMNKAWGIDQFFCNLTPLRLEKCAYFVPIFSLILASGLDA
jgi:hypothetical protein